MLVAAGGARAGTRRGAEWVGGRRPRKLGLRLLSSVPSELSLETVGKVLVVQLKRPSRMNALSFGMGSELLGVFERAAAAPEEHRAIVVTGSGDRAFSTGRDLKDSKAHSKADADRYMRLCQDTVRAAFASRVPTVAAVNGHAFGWGMELALACDLRVASASAMLCFPECGLGIFPGALGTVLLPRIAGPAVAKDLILTSRRFGAEEALRLGVVNRTAPSAAAALEEALALATAIAANGPLGVRGARTVIDDGLDLDFADHVALSHAHRLPLNDTDDFKEALAAFADGRKPEFRGR